MSTEKKKEVKYWSVQDVMDGLHAISLVDFPAIERDFVALSTTQRAHVATLSKMAGASKNPTLMTVTGPLMIPDLPIYRIDGEGTEYYCAFSRETIRECIGKFMRRGSTHAVTHMHSADMHGNYVQEMWIIADTKRDKAAALGMHLPAGTLMVTVQCEKTYWDAEVKTGNVRGFSLEGLFSTAPQKGGILSSLINKKAKPKSLFSTTIKNQDMAILTFFDADGAAIAFVAPEESGEHTFPLYDAAGVEIPGASITLTIPAAADDGDGGSETEEELRSQLKKMEAQLAAMSKNPTKVGNKAAGNAGAGGKPNSDTMSAVQKASAKLKAARN